jgi:general secretion pathway protein I
VSDREHGSGCCGRCAEHRFRFCGRYAEHGFRFCGCYAEHGFTLIETLVALAIFSLAALALLRLEGATIASTAMLSDWAVGQIVARNLAVGVMTDVRAPAFGGANGTVVNAGRTWRWVRDTKRTDDVRIVRIDIAVTDDAGRPSGALSMARTVE